MGNLLKEKGAYQILIGEFISYKKGHLEKEKGHLLQGKAAVVKGKGALIESSNDNLSV